ncbi:unnamed protein product (macronuclear) [Paramecium tetraurelia]|uniref:Transmembrane protein n=1 Tax=Paramecium tetraurelia TaxID=5888 RepID=A0C1W6_PARTE|nr:uncharacterized protein GSPATT00034260001 [Paramecium tetraurelia]CAK64783.1 unnamed protein product [Paramecium tetraurelia]|eukprot:XP_001432180.1 hypothetical protein (macronuclear) [Paramecium tetraurelia strain d4-2]
MLNFSFCRMLSNQSENEINYYVEIHSHIQWNIEIHYPQNSLILISQIFVIFFKRLCYDVYQLKTLQFFSQPFPSFLKQNEYLVIQDIIFFLPITFQLLLNGKTEQISKFYQIEKIFKEWLVSSLFINCGIHVLIAFCRFLNLFCVCFSC